MSDINTDYVGLNLSVAKPTVITYPNYQRVIEKIEAIMPLETSRELSEMAYRQACIDCTAILKAEAGE